MPRFPGDREDNLWLCYDADKVPRNEQEWRDKNFVHKTHFGYYSWPAEMKVGGCATKGRDPKQNKC